MNINGQIFLREPLVLVNYQKCFLFRLLVNKKIESFLGGKKNSLKLLLELSNRVFYELIFNTVLKIAKDVFWYCFCVKFSGCWRRNGIKDHFYLCQIQSHYSLLRLEKIKNNPFQLIKIILNLFDNLKMLYILNGYWL